MSRLNRAFSHKEIALILFLTLVLLVMVYYRFVYVPIQREIESYDTTNLESQIIVEQGRAAKIRKMKEEIAAGHKNYNGEVKTYDNQEGEINTLYLIFEDAETYHITARQPVATGNAVRRNMDLSFTAASYETAEKIIYNISNSEYRCLIGNLVIRPGERMEDINSGKVNVTTTVTFFETLTGTDNRDGLLIQNN